MRIYQAGLGGLLAAHAAALSALTASAPLPVSATVISVCAVSADDAMRSSRPAAGRGLARIDCSPAAAYTISSAPQMLSSARLVSWRDDRMPSAPLTTLPARRGDRDAVMVTEIAY